jgi:hypothetical protein
MNGVQPDKDNIPVMSPHELQVRWNLTNVELAAALGKTEETIKAYLARSETKSFRRAPYSTQLLCRRLHENWLISGTANVF